MTESEPSRRAAESPSPDRFPLKEAAVILSAMALVAVVTLTFAIKLLRDTTIVNKSTREANPPTIREPLPVPVVAPLPPKKDDGDSGATAPEDGE